MRYLVILVANLIVLCSGCAYQAKKLVVQEKVEFSYKAEKENVRLFIYAFFDSENNGYFKKYVPLRLQITNSSKNTYVLDSKNIGLELVSFDELSEKVPRLVLSYFIPSAIFTLGGILFLWQVCLPLALAAGIGSLFFGKFHKRKTIKRLKRMTLNPQEKIEIRPFGKIDKVIFVKKENYNPSFKLSLLNFQKKAFLMFNVLITTKNSLGYRF